MSQSMVHPARCAKTRSFGNKVHIALRDIQKCREQGSLWKRLTNAFTRSERRSGKIQRNRLHQTHSKQVRSCPELSQAHSKFKIQKRYQDDVTGVSLIQYHNPISSSGSVGKGIAPKAIQFSQNSGHYTSGQAISKGPRIADAL